MDTASLYFRAWFALPGSLRAPDGTPVNAVRGLLDMIARLVEQHSPAAVCCAWDNDWRPPWRVELVPSYKTHRLSAPDQPQPAGLVVGAGGRAASSEWIEQTDPGLRVQLPIIRQVLDACSLPVLGVDGYEADDVLASLCALISGAGPGGPTGLVVTGDRDLFQLVRPGVEVIYLSGAGKQQLVEDTWLASRYGIIGQQYADFVCLRGDPSDGLPGVPGIGEKTAAGLLARHGDLSAVLAAAQDPAEPMPSRIRSALNSASDELLRVSRVVHCVTDLPVTLPAGRPADATACAQLALRYGLGGPIGRLLAALGQPGLPGLGQTQLGQ